MSFLLGFVSGQAIGAIGGFLAAVFIHRMSARDDTNEKPDATETQSERAW